MDQEGLPAFAAEPADSAASRWERWLKRFTNYTVAKDITDERRMKAILLHYVGEEVFELAESLGIVDDTSLENTKHILTAYFAPQRNIEYEVYVFRQAAQLGSESLDKFHARLRQLAKNCNFNDLDREVRSQIIQRCQLGKVRDKGLSDAHITLSELLKFGRTLEATNAQGQAMANNHASMTGNSAGNVTDRSIVNKLSVTKSATQSRGASTWRSRSHQQAKPNAAAATWRTTSHQRNRKSPNDGADNWRASSHHSLCNGCGAAPHVKRQLQCPAWGQRCHLCQRENHFASVCRSKSQVQHVTAIEPELSTAIQHVSCDRDDILDLNTLQTKNATVKPYMYAAMLNDVVAQMEIDTGAATSIISLRQLESLRRGTQSLPLGTDNLPTLRTYAGQLIQPAGRVTVDVRHRDETHRLSCLVVDGDVPNLLGRDWLEHLKLDWSTVHRVEENVDFARMFPELFSEGLGKLKGVEAKLYIDSEAVPRCFKPRTVPLALRGKVDSELDRLQAEGVLVPVEHSEWAAPIVPVLKANGEVRICGDYKLTVNKAAKIDKFPIPNIEDLYAKLSGGVAYSKLDLSNAYQQVVLSADSQKLTTITTLKGLFAYTRLCYGVASAPGIFQREMEQLVQNIPMVAVYLDDILVSGHTYEEAKTNLVTVLSRLQTAGLRLRLEKCAFMQASCVYLGHRLDAEGIHPTTEKLQAVQQAPAPTSVSELRSYLGMVNYYHKFLKNLSAVLAPLHQLLQKGTSWHWGSPQKRAFEQSKALLQSSQVLVHYDPSLPLLLSCDASPYGIGAVLSHRMANGTDRPVAFASRSLVTAEKNYAQVEREGLAVVFGVTKFHRYVYGRNFEIQTDHRPLLGLLGEHKLISPLSSARIQRWALTLSNYQYTLRYKPGVQNGNADGLSRLPLPTEPSSIPVPAEVVLSLSIVDDTPITAAKIAQWTSRDPILSAVAGYVRQGWPSNTDDVEDAYSRRRNELTIQQGCLLWGSRVIIPTPGRERILEELHECHPGIVRMKSLARSYVWWPGLDAEIENKVRSCGTCQEHSKLPAKAVLHPWEWPGKAWYRLHIDYAGPFEGKMILVIVDAHSKYIDAHVMSSATSTATIRSLRQTFATHGLPCTIVSDNGTAFTSQEFRAYCRSNGIKHICSAPFHPATNGLAERAVQTVVKQGLRKTSGPDLETRLYNYLARYRVTPQSTTGESPAQMLNSKLPRIKLDLLLPQRENRVLGHQEQARDYRTSTDTSETAFYAGDAVWAMNFAGKPKWLPGVLTDRTGPVSFIVSMTDGRIWRRHADHLRPRLPDENVNETFPPPDPSAVSVVPPTAPPIDVPLSEPESRQPPSTPIVSKPQSSSPIISTPQSSSPISNPRRSARVIKPPIRLDL